MSYLKKDGKRYWVIESECIGRSCLALGAFQHRVSLCCLRNASPLLSADGSAPGAPERHSASERALKGEIHL